MSRALLVGIDHYNKSPLKGCIEDAKRMKEVLSRNYDQSPNFYCKLLTSDQKKISVAQLQKEIEHLLKGDAEVALFYFSGHGSERNLDGYLVTQDTELYDQGYPITRLLRLVNNATHIKEIVIILDCCHAGNMGNLQDFGKDTALLRKGVSILTASQGDEYSVMRNGKSLFTTIVVNALEGGAADLLGNITAPDIYHYADKVLGPWEQRPVFKSHVSKLFPIRKVKPKLSHDLLRKLTFFFESSDDEYPLDREYEPTEKLGNFKKEKLFGVLQKYTSANLLEPVGEEHMYYAAINGKSCRLTHIGKFYWLMVTNDKI